MMEERGDPTRQSIGKPDNYPAWWLTGGLVLACAVLAWFGWNSRQSLQQRLAAQDRTVRYQRLAGEIAHLDEVLTMSARMAAATSERQWEARYRQAEPQLNAAIEQVLHLAPDSDVRRMASQIDSANRRLVEMEHQALEWASKGRAEEANALLSGEDYEHAKQAYDAGLTAMMRLIDRRLAALDQADAQRDRLWQWGALLAIGMTLVVWLIAMRRLKRWRDDLVAAEAERTDEAEARLQVEASLRQSEEQLLTVIDDASDVIFALDADGLFTSLNPAFETIFKMSRAEWIGKSFTALIHPPDLPLATGWFSHVLNGEQSPVFELRVGVRSGVILTIELTATPRFVEEKIVGVTGIARDVSRRKQAEDLIERLSRFPSENPNPVLRISHQGILEYANEASTILLPMLGEEVGGRVSSEWQAHIDKALSMGHMDNLEFNAAGRVFYATLAPIAEYGYVNLYANDITEQKLAEASASSSLQLLSGVVNAIPVRVFWKNRDLVYLGCNAAFARDAGFADPREIISKDDFQMAWRDQAELYRADDRHVIESGCPKLLIEEPQTTPEGETITLLTSKIPLRDSTGEISGVIGTYMDVTEHKRAEESQARLATAVEQAVETVLITDTMGTIQYVNPAFEKITGYTRDEVIGKTPRILCSGKHDASFYQAMWETLAAGKTWSGRLINRRKDGTLYEEDSSISPVRDAAGTIVNYVAVKRDVTHETLLEAQLLQSQKMQALGQMASGIAHDFNNALSPILGFSEILLDSPTKLMDVEKATRYLKIIHTCGLDAASVVRRLREFGRQRETSEMASSLDLVTLVKETIILTQPRWMDQALAEDRTIAIETDLQPVPPFVGEESSLRELLTNLIFNAVDALPIGGTIRLRTLVEGQQALLQVSDNGTGMTEEVRQRCLEPFFSTKGEAGTGLGLAMVFGIVERHGGTVEIESEAGRGTTFNIRLPIILNTTELNDLTPVPKLGKSLHILVVDDEPALREVLSLALAEDGHKVVTAADGIDGLAAFTPYLFDLVITDKAMPRMNGEQLALAIHELAPGQPVVMLTGFGDLMNAAGELPTGVTVVLTKPVTQEVLRQAMAEVLL